MNIFIIFQPISKYFTKKIISKLCKFFFLFIYENRNGKKKYHVMRFNSVLNVDFSKWGQVKMERENNQKEFKTLEEEQPK